MSTRSIPRSEVEKYKDSWLVTHKNRPSTTASKCICGNYHFRGTCTHVAVVLPVRCGQTVSTINTAMAIFYETPAPKVVTGFTVEGVCKDCESNASSTKKA